MAKVRLTVDVDPEVEEHITSIAASENKSVNDWIEEAVSRELQPKTEGKSQETERIYVAQGISMPAPGVEPKGIANPPRLRGAGGTVADAVIEGRR